MKTFKFQKVLLFAIAAIAASCTILQNSAVFADEPYVIGEDIIIQQIYAGSFPMSVVTQAMKAPQIFLEEPDADEPGAVAVIWKNVSCNFLNQRQSQSIWSKTSFDYGNTWEEVRRVFVCTRYGYNQDNVFVSMPQVDFRSGGSVYLTYNAAGGKNWLHRPLYVSYSSDYGLTWDSAQIINHLYEYPVLEVDPLIYKTCSDNFGRVYTLSKVDMSQGERLILSYNLDGDENWSHINLGPAGDFKEATMTCDENGHIYLVGIKRQVHYSDPANGHIYHLLTLRPITINSEAPGINPPDAIIRPVTIPQEE